MVPLGTPAPDFSLPDPRNNATLAYEDISGEKGTLVAFICNHCPYVKLIADELAHIGEEYMMKGIGFVAISSNDADRYPDDSPEKMVEESNRRGYTFPYLYDETQEVARAYNAVCTPDFFLFDSDRRLVYRGQFDNARPGNKEPINGADLRRALDATCSGEEIEGEQKPAVGCNIKWK